MITLRSRPLARADDALDRDGTSLALISYGSTEDMAAVRNWFTEISAAVDASCDLIDELNLQAASGLITIRALTLIGIAQRALSRIGRTKPR